MTLNMMRSCCLNPLLSAHEAMDGLFLFDATSLAPLGTKVLVHLKPTQRKSWGYHAAKAWYLFHAANHFWCIQVITRGTGGKCITNTFRFQHYARAVDPTLLAALSAIAMQQANGTRAVANACHQLLDYVAMHPNAGLHYHACNMILAVHTDASYLSETGSKSHATGHFYLTNQNNKDFNNGAVLALSTTINHVISLASKAKLAALYYGCKIAAPLHITIEEMGHAQPKPTPVTTSNITAQGLTMGTMTPRASKFMDQCLHWLKCRDAQR